MCRSKRPIDQYREIVGDRPGKDQLVFVIGDDDVRVMHPSFSDMDSSDFLIDMVDVNYRDLKAAILKHTNGCDFEGTSYFCYPVVSDEEAQSSVQEFCNELGFEAREIGRWTYDNGYASREASFALAN